MFITEQLVFTLGSEKILGTLMCSISYFKLFVGVTQCLPFFKNHHWVGFSFSILGSQCHQYQYITI
jgi:hypothetical protein